MNYELKMIAVVMALGVLVLQGCQTKNNNAINIPTISNPLPINIPIEASSDDFLCQFEKKTKNKNYYYIGIDIVKSLKELKKRGVSREKCIELTGNEGIYVYDNQNIFKKMTLDELCNYKNI